MQLSSDGTNSSEKKNPMKNLQHDLNLGGKRENRFQIPFQGIATTKACTKLRHQCMFFFSYQKIEPSNVPEMIQKVGEKKYINVT